MPDTLCPWHAPLSPPASDAPGPAPLRVHPVSRSHPQKQEAATAQSKVAGAEAARDKLNAQVATLTAQLGAEQEAARAAAGKARKEVAAKVRGGGGGAGASTSGLAAWGGAAG